MHFQIVVSNDCVIFEEENWENDDGCGVLIEGARISLGDV